MKIKVFIITQILLICLGFQLLAQTHDIFTDLKSKKSRADKHFSEYSFANALDLYLEVVEMRRYSEELIIKERIAECYRRLNNPAESEKWYEKIMDHQGIEPIYMLHYAQALSSNKKYELAKKWYLKYQEKVTKDTRITHKVNSIDFMDDHYRDSIYFKVKEAKELNSVESDFSPVYYGDGIVFCSAREKDFIVKNVNKWHDGAFLDLFYSVPNGEGVMSEPTLFHTKVNSRYHEGPMAFYKYGNSMIFTRTNFHKRKTGKSSEGVFKLKMYEMHKKGPNLDWGDATPFKYNDDNYNTGHPTLDKRGSTLYFVSDKLGGYGGTDIYKCERIKNIWTPPVNLGPDVNTAGNEMFPFIYSDTILYFASDGYGGLGGLDIYMTKYDKASDKWGNIKNLGFPINTNLDDFGLIVEPSGRLGYFTSNRAGGTGDDDIYKVDIFDSTRAEIIGSVLLSDLGELHEIGGAKVLIREKGSETPIYQSTTGYDGKFYFRMIKDKDYEIAVRNELEEEDLLVKPLKVNGDVDGIDLVLNSFKQAVTGHVVFNTSDSMKLAGAKVVLRPRGYPDSVIATTVTDETGVFQFVATRGKGAQYDIFVEYIKEPRFKNLYQFNINKNSKDMLIAVNPECVKYKGMVKDNETNNRLSCVTMYLYDKLIGAVDSTLSDDEGNFEFCLVPGREYIMQGNKSDYMPDSYKIRISEDQNQDMHEAVSFNLNRIAENKSFVVRFVYYDYMKWDIREDAGKELDKVVKFLRDNPYIDVELSSHTDSRGSDHYNMWLSGKRAQAAVDYVASKGIKESRLTAKAEGEARIMNKCKNGVACTEEEHQDNRRTEIKIRHIDQKKKKESEKKEGEAPASALNN